MKNVSVAIVHQKGGHFCLALGQPGRHSSAVLLLG
jgi:hypothetical protein